MGFSTLITVPEQRPDQAKALREQLRQDGFSESELNVPDDASSDFVVLLDAARAFANEIGPDRVCTWPLRCERWLNRLSVMLTARPFTEHPAGKRRAICHAAVTLAERPDLLL